MSTLTGTRPMLGLTLRRERLHGSAWYVLSGLLLVVIAAGIVSTYPTAADRETLAASVNASAGELFIIGPVSSTDVGGIGLRPTGSPTSPPSSTPWCAPGSPSM